VALNQEDAVIAEQHQPGRERDTVLYRLEVGGPVGPEWVGWLEAEALTQVGENTVLDIRVADQAELYGRLRRIHDLNLTLISMVRIDFHGPSGVRNDPQNPKFKEELS
jgi:hypothetical protein